MLTCANCGASYSPEWYSCPDCASASQNRSLPRPEFLPLRGLGNVLIIVLALVIGAIAARLVIQGLALGSAHWRGMFIGKRLDKAADITMFGLGIGFVVWLRRARINAEHRGWRQRRNRAWAFWGWILPLVNLWIPFQMMGDIWRAGLPLHRRRKIAWLPALWWSSWLLSGLGGGAADNAAHYPWPHLSGGTWVGSMGFLAASGAALIALIHIISTGPVGSPHPRPPSGPRREPGPAVEQGPAVEPGPAGEPG